MKSKVREKFHLTIDEKIIVSFFFGTTSEGFSFGLILPNRNIHLTVFYNNESKLLHYHITDNNVPVGRRRQPIGKHIEIDVIGEEVLRRVKSWFKKYHHNQKGWILKPVVKKKVQNILFPKEQEKGVTNIPFYSRFDLPGFDDSSCWTRVRLRTIADPSELIFLEGERIIRYAFIVNGQRMLAFSESQLENLFEYLFNVMGFEDYIQYIKRKVPRKEWIHI